MPIKPKNEKIALTHSGVNARAAREFPSPRPPFLPAPPERFGILRNAAGVSLKKSSRIFKDRAPNRICQIFGGGRKGLLAAPRGAARKELGGKIKRRDEIPRHNFFGNEAVRHNEVMYKNNFLFQFFAQNIPLRGIEAIFHSLAEHLPAVRQVSHAKI